MYCTEKLCLTGLLVTNSLKENLVGGSNVMLIFSGIQLILHSGIHSYITTGNNWFLSKGVVIS